MNWRKDFYKEWGLKEGVRDPEKEKELRKVQAAQQEIDDEVREKEEDRKAVDSKERDDEVSRAKEVGKLRGELKDLRKETNEEGKAVIDDIRNEYKGILNSEQLNRFKIEVQEIRKPIDKKREKRREGEVKKKKNKDLEESRQGYIAVTVEKLKALRKSLYVNLTGKDSRGKLWRKRSELLRDRITATIERAKDMPPDYCESLYLTYKNEAIDLYDEYRHQPPPPEKVRPRKRSTTYKGKKGQKEEVVFGKSFFKTAAEMVEAGEKALKRETEESSAPTKKEYDGRGFIP